MADPGAFGPLLKQILVPAAVELPVAQLRLPSNDPPTLDEL
jgi:hypothetical protein